MKNLTLIGGVKKVHHKNSAKMRFLSIVLMVVMMTSMNISIVFGDTQSTPTVEASQSLDKPALSPGTDSVTAEIKLDGLGTPEAPQRKPIDLVLCIDNSGSMEWGNEDYNTAKPWRIDFAKEAAIGVVDFLQAQDRAAVVEFAGSVWVQQNLTSDKETLKQSITATPESPWDGTDIAGGINLAETLLNQNSSSDREKVIILVSDGASDFNSAINMAKLAESRGYKIYSIALGASTDQNLMRSVAEITSGNYGYCETMEELNGMMIDFAGEIFNSAGKNIVLQTTIPDNGMDVDTSKMDPEPTSVINNKDGTITLKWTSDNIIIGEQKVFEIKYNGTNLVSGTEILLSKDTKLTYQDRNDTTVVINLPDLKISVSKYIFESKVVTDKTSYSENENVNIVNTVKNLTSYTALLKGKVEIIDTDGNVVKAVAENVDSTWSNMESKDINFLWNTEKTAVGTYKVRATWSDGTNSVSIAETSFEVKSATSITNKVTVDKEKYLANQDVTISGTVKNNSDTNNEYNLSVKTIITNSKGETLWSTGNQVSEILKGSESSLKNVWNTSKNSPDKYTVKVEVYKAGTKISENSTTFDIEEDTSVNGSLQISQDSIYPEDDVALSYKINNIGNTNLTDATVRINIVNSSTKEVVGTLIDKTNIDASSSSLGEKVWSHGAIKVGTYKVSLDLVLSNGKEIPLSSGSINVKSPYDTKVSTTTRGRVLVWAESSANINLAKKTLDGMNVFYKIVNNRDDFMAELKTYKYNLYMLLDCKLPLRGHEDDLLAAEVASGKGIIASRDANADNFKNFGIFGVKFRGSTTPSSFTVNFPSDSPFGQLTLTGSGKAQNVQVINGRQLATLNSKKGATPGVVISKYGSGKSLLFSFDIGGCSGDTTGVLKRAVELVAPPNEVNSGYTELEVKVKANANIGAELKLNLPTGSEIVWLSPSADLWRFNTVKGNEYIFRAIVKLPSADKQYSITVDSYYGAISNMIKFDTDQLNVLSGSMIRMKTILKG